MFSNMLPSTRCWTNGEMLMTLIVIRSRYVTLIMQPEQWYGFRIARPALIVLFNMVYMYQGTVLVWKCINSDFQTLPLNGWPHNNHKSIAWHTAHTIVSYLALNNAPDLMMIIRQGAYILTIITWETWVSFSCPKPDFVFYKFNLF